MYSVASFEGHTCLLGRECKINIHIQVALWEINASTLGTKTYELSSFHSFILTFCFKSLPNFTKLLEYRYTYTYKTAIRIGGIQGTSDLIKRIKSSATSLNPEWDFTFSPLCFTVVHSENYQNPVSEPQRCTCGFVIMKIWALQFTYKRLHRLITVVSTTVSLYCKHQSNQFFSTFFNPFIVNRKRKCSLTGCARFWSLPTSIVSFFVVPALTAAAAAAAPASCRV